MYFCEDSPPASKFYVTCLTTLILIFPLFPKFFRINWGIFYILMLSAKQIKPFINVNAGNIINVVV